MLSKENNQQNGGVMQPEVKLRRYCYQVDYMISFHFWHLVDVLIQSEKLR